MHIHVCMCACMFPSMHVEVRRQLVGVESPLLPCEFYKSNMDHQAWWYFIFFLIRKAAAVIARTCPSRSPSTGNGHNSVNRPDTTTQFQSVLCLRVHRLPVVKTNKCQEIVFIYGILQFLDVTNYLKK